MKIARNVMELMKITQFMVTKYPIQTLFHEYSLEINIRRIRFFQNVDVDYGYSRVFQMKKKKFLKNATI